MVVFGKSKHPKARLKVAQPEADNWSNEQVESSGENEILEELKLKIESSSRSSELQISKIDELAEKIELLENKEKELESENEKLRIGFENVVFENSIAHALLMQNVRRVQSAQVGQNLRFMKSLEDRLRAYEHQQREPIIEIKRDFVKLKQDVTDNHVPLEEIVDLQELGNFIQQKVLSYLLQSTPSIDEIAKKTEK
ncbi:unnamed protein product [Oikopleura dioica]|uniref:Uncharacterized protein n=1 Tax=Oikopleura dioica TaxID=34765 RepID=E4XW39_OIKDI|nr:unnamed protein product [Oikopleura dioica]